MGRDAPEPLPGTLDFLILRTLLAGRPHCYGIAQHLKEVSEEVLQVGESSLYPALQRSLLNGRVKAEWRSFLSWPQADACFPRGDVPPAVEIQRRLG